MDSFESTITDLSSLCRDDVILAMLGLQCILISVSDLDSIDRLVGTLQVAMVALENEQWKKSAENFSGTKNISINLRNRV